LPQIAMLHHLRARPRVRSANISVQAGPSHAFTFDTPSRSRSLPPHSAGSMPGIARYGEPEEIAELMAFLVSPPARWMTGSTLRMDGGEVKSV
jgi:NAD(P)-dependent dehydrogenase (short-subunit alcohol dehydrogenase family)